VLLMTQGRLVFPAFGEYIRLHPPFNYIAVTAALYGVAFLVFLHVAGADWLQSLGQHLLS
jgi:hypothetical protein